MLPAQGSTVAPQVDTILFVLIGLSSVFVLIIVAGLAYFSYKYRRGSTADRSNPPSSNLRLELIWIGASLVLGVGVFIWAASLYFNMVNPPADAINIYVVGKQWMWKFQHPEGPGEIDDLHVPVNRSIRLTMISQDVIHSFFIPDFRVKQDVLPGRYTSLWFQATKPGIYNLFCTQFCGAGHPVMGGRVIVLDAAQYAQWLQTSIAGMAATPVPGTADDSGVSVAFVGAQLFQQYNCAGCHVANGTGSGPSLVGLYGHAVTLSDGSVISADDSYLRDSILVPDHQIVVGYKSTMPSYQGQLDEDQIVQLIAYIRSLGQASGVTS